MKHDGTYRDDDPVPASHGDDGALRLQLRAQRRDAVPARDLWPGIAQRIAQSPAGSAKRALPPRQRASRFAPWAMAASLLLVGLAWQQRPVPGPFPDKTARLIHREAEAMTLEYNAALRELQASTSMPHAPARDDALRELDRSAAQIRTALARDPDARFLLDRLRSTYSRRLALTQRAAMT